MIEAMAVMVEEKRRQVAGESPFVEDAMLDELARLDSREYDRLAPSLKLLVGFHLAARRLAAEPSENSSAAGRGG